MKLREGNFRMNVRKTFLTVRHFKLWNSLRKEMVETPVLLKVTGQSSGKCNVGNKQDIQIEGH